MKNQKLFIIILVCFMIGGVFVFKSLRNNSIASVEYETNIQDKVNINIQDNIMINNDNNHNKIKNDKIEAQKQTVEKSYFDNALFIGDSRTVGISEYGDLHNATFFANTGMSVYNVFENDVSVPRVGKLKLEQLLKFKKFKKVYIMLGINELGYDINQTLEKYKKLVKYIENNQEDAIIYIQSNLHVTEEKSKRDNIINNTNINKFNYEISKFADNKKIFYIDINKKFDDANGNLTSEYTADNVHIYAKYYKEWSDWLSQNAVRVGG